MISLKTRLTIRFLLLLIACLLTVPLSYLMTVIIYNVYYEGGNNETYQDNFYVGDWLREIVNETTYKQEKAQVSPAVIKQLKERNAWLQILDHQGREIYRFGVPPSWPKRLTAGQLAEEEAMDRGLSTWHAPKNGEDLTWVLRLQSYIHLKYMAQDVKRNGESLQLPQQWKNRLQKEKAWVQVLNDKGKEIYQFHRPANQPTQLSPGKLLEKKQILSEDSRSQIWYDPDHKETWIYGVNEIDFKEKLIEIGQMGTTGMMLIWIIVVSWWYGRQLGKPLLHIMGWIQSLARGAYIEPTDRDGSLPSRNTDGKLTRPYRIYRDVIEAMDHLTKTLKQSEVERKRLETTREEWITGVSHDMKTPLSSVKGYATLLETEHYQWTADEVRSHARVIREKSEHMERLLEDLNLTYRLKNDVLPLSKEPTQVKELVRRVAVDLANHKLAKQAEIQFHAPEGERLLYPLDPHWFKRAIDNMAINALVHNPPNTQVILEVKGDSFQQEPSVLYPGIYIRIRDNGHGMDEETQQNLFKRYYRGTHTHTSEGTGLGLAIAEQLIRAHGGSINVHSVQDKGTTMEIYLPPLQN
ncbi:sensor histidine kinase [Melghirimyces algeriensis]|uniref:histidine kinase n=1 Tax=Melghirimyces algeriensis TaxID=910412 RepID=A0A521AD11_9BACL|nr:HAMP domain-containing sensor histidine kinase [Melghirimyces algeriensis]SMO32702.1 Signal transduction histidine kinase [Melghirimyces algeriensis]